MNQTLTPSTLWLAIKQDRWLLVAAVLFVLCSVLAGAVIIFTLNHQWIGFGGLVAVVLYVGAIYACSLFGGIGSVLSLVSWIKHGRQRAMLLVLSCNVLLALGPVAVLNIQIWNKQRQQQATIAAMTPTQHLFELVMGGRIDYVEGQQEFVSFIKQGANINALDSQGMTPLIRYIIYRRNIEVLEFLLSHGAQLEGQTNYGWTPLHTAARSGKIYFVKVLLNHGADPLATTAEGKTALDLVHDSLQIETNPNEIQNYQTIAAMLTDVMQRKTKSN